VNDDVHLLQLLEVNLVRRGPEEVVEQCRNEGVDQDAGENRLHRESDGLVRTKGVPDEPDEDEDAASDEAGDSYSERCAVESIEPLRVVLEVGVDASRVGVGHFSHDLEADDSLLAEAADLLVDVVHDERLQLVAERDETCELCARDLAVLVELRCDAVELGERLLGLAKLGFVE